MRVGDAVATIAQPVAKSIDHAFGTDLANCGGCKDRQGWLNNLSDTIVDIFVSRLKDKDTSPMEYYVTKTRSILVTADSPSKAEEAVARGEGEEMSTSTNVQARPQQAQQGLPGVVRPPIMPSNAITSPPVAIQPGR